MAGGNKTWVCRCGIANWWGADCLQCGATRDEGWTGQDRRRHFAVRVFSVWDNSIKDRELVLEDDENIRLDPRLVAYPWC